MMAHDRVENTRLTISYESFINQFPPDTIKSILQLERTYTKIRRQNMSILFNEIRINIETLTKCTHARTRTHTHTHIYIYIYIKFQFESYQRLKKWYLMPSCLTLSIIRYGSRVKLSKPGIVVEPYPTSRCCSYWKWSSRVTLDYGRPTLLLYIYI